MNLAEAIDFHARSRPDHIAVEAGPVSVTYGAFAAKVWAVEHRLREAGIERLALVGVCLKDTVEHLAIIYALARMGAVMLPMDWRWSQSEKQRLVNHFAALAVIVEDEAVALDGCADLRVAALARPVPAGTTTAPPATGPDLPLLLSLSSGTTGRPKGPRITHDQMLRRFWTHWINLGLNADDRYVSATPLYFGGGRTFAMSVLFAGGTVLLFPPPFEAAALCREVEARAATSAFLVPTQLRKLLELPDEERGRMRRLRLLLSSGSPLYPGERAAIRESVCGHLVEYYASTEGGGVSIAKPRDQGLHADSVGRAVFAVEIEIVDDGHRRVPPGEIGRLRYRGPGVATGYFNDDEASGQAFHEGWFYPGDLAEIDADGYVFLRGRTKDIIIRGGVNIHPGEIETILCSHPAVSEAAVIGRPAPVLGEEVVAFVTLLAALDDVALTAWCRERLAPYKVPVEIRIVAGLPKNSAGKVLKSELATLLAQL